MLFQSLYSWIVPFNSSTISNSLSFWSFILFLYIRIFLYTSCELRLHSSVLLMNLNYLYIKEKTYTPV